jgi:hypothetical protein
MAYSKTNFKIKLEAQLKEKGMRKSDFYRQLVTAWVEGKVTIKADKKHILSK